MYLSEGREHVACHVVVRTLTKLKSKKLGAPTWYSRFNQTLSRECGLRLAPVCFRQGKVGTPYSQGRLSKRIPLHPPLETQKQKLGGSTWYSKFNQSLRTGSLPTGSLCTLVDWSAAPPKNGNRKSLKENVDLDSHLSDIYIYM